MKLTKSTTVQFQNSILSWYQVNKRDLPWRKTRDPYAILVSEVMSQQTQVSRVLPKYNAWMEKFPTVFDLAVAKVSDVLLYWSGLGYNRRALNLKKTAVLIVTKYKGTFPIDEKQLRQLPGIGEYTARAVLCFAFNKQIAVVDTNVRKVILTQFAQEEGKNIQEVADALLPQGQAYEWNQALMDYAAAVLKKHKILIPKQSKFIGSHRYYRGKLLKELLQKKIIPQSDIGILLKKDYSVADEEWLTGLLKELTDEGFIRIKRGIIRLVE
jgi:A/G-specific adenine glycosylase